MADAGRHNGLRAGGRLTRNVRQGVAPDLRSRTFVDLVKGFGSLAGASFAGQILGLLALAVVARRVGPSGVGSYTFCVALTLYFVLPVNFGITNIAIRDVASGDYSLETVIREVATAQLLLSLTMYGVLIALTPTLATNRLARDLMPIVGLTVFTNALNFEWALQARGRLGTNGLWRLGSQVVYFVLVLLFVGGSPAAGTERFAVFTMVGYGIIAVGTLTSTVRELGGFPGLASPQDAWRRVRRSATTGYSLAMIQIYYSIDSVMLGYLKDPAVVGIYGVAYRVPLAFMALCQVWASAIVPHAAALFKTDPTRLRQDLGRAVGASIVLAVGAVAVALVCASTLMQAAFGLRYAMAAAPFAVLMAAGAVVLVGTNIAPVVTAGGSRRPFAIATTAGAAVNVAVNFLLIPQIGATGAAAATVAAELVVIGYMGITLRGMLGSLALDFRRIGRGVGVAILAAAAVYAAFPLLDAWARFGCASAMFLGGAVITRALDPKLLRRGRS